MSAKRISASSYSNTAPLIWSFLYGTNRGRYELILDNAPARSAELLRQNRIDAALVPVIEYQRIKDVLLIPDVCVGAKEKVQKRLSRYKRRRFERCQNRFARHLFAHFGRADKNYFQRIFRFRATIQNLETESDGNAQRIRLRSFDRRSGIDDFRSKDQGQRTKDQLRKFDLAETWKTFTGFGFVFAMWMANKDKAAAAKTIDFSAARDEGLRHLDEIISNYETEISLTHEDFKKYLAENISYSVSDSMRKGLQLYFKLAKKHNLIEENKPLSFL